MSVVRYLGVFLGTSEAVARVWEEKVTGKIRQRYGSWLSQGGASAINFGYRLQGSACALHTAGAPARLLFSTAGSTIFGMACGMEKTMGVGGVGARGVGSWS